MARNVVVSAHGFLPAEPIYFRYSPAYPLPGGQIDAQTDSTGAAEVTIVGLPASECGQALNIQTFQDINFMRQGYPESDGSVVDNCGPLLYATHSASSLALFGDGFTPGGQVRIDASFAGTPTTTSQTVTATTERAMLHCGLVGLPPVYSCSSIVVTPPGQLSVTIPTPCPLTGKLAYSVTATDLSTQQKTVYAEAYQPSCPQLPPGLGL
jgi:hypothetical protein